MFKEKLKEGGINIKEFADLIQLSRGTVYAALSQGAKNGLPTWAKSFVVGFELGKQQGREEAEKNRPLRGEGEKEQGW